MLATYTVEGMTCNHCVHAIKTEVAAIPGVTSVELDLESENLKISRDAGPLPSLRECAPSSCCSLVWCLRPYPGP